MLFLNVSGGLLRVVNSLRLHSWKHLLAKDVGDDLPTFSRVFLTSVDVVKQRFFTKERTLAIYFS